MAQEHDTGGATATRARDALSPCATLDSTPENLSIFSAPALEVVFQWWVDSKRRWTERNGATALIPVGTVRRLAQSVAAAHSPSRSYEDE